MKTYTELSRISDFYDRFEYLSLNGVIGLRTFGSERYLNQRFYTSREWRDVRHEVIARDEGMDLGVPGFEIFNKITIHHMNPISAIDIDEGNPDILNPEYLITVSHNTHNAIHYGDGGRLPQPMIIRQPGDTREW